MTFWTGKPPVPVLELPSGARIKLTSARMASDLGIKPHVLATARRVGVYYYTKGWRVGWMVYTKRKLAVLHRDRVNERKNLRVLNSYS